MDDDAVGAEQAQRLCLVLEAAGVGAGALWLQYFRLGGQVGEVEIDAYLHLALGLPRFERDLLAHAANELIGHATGHHAPYSWELLNADRTEKADGTGRADGGRGPDGPVQQ